MLPTKLKTLLSPLAAEFGLSEQTVSALATAYFKQVQQHLSSPTQLAVDVPNLGLFTIKPKALDRKVSRLQTNVARLSTHNSARSKATLAQYLSELEDLEKLQKLLQEETSRRKTKRNLRYGNPAPTADQPHPDSGRVQKQPAAP